MRIARVSSTLICYCSQLQSSVAHLNVSFSRVVPTPLCPLLSKLLSGLFCISGLPAEIPFQLPVFNLFSGTKVDQNIQELMSKLAKCWNTSWWLSVSPRQTSHGHLFDMRLSTSLARSCKRTTKWSKKRKQTTNLSSGIKLKDQMTWWSKDWKVNQKWGGQPNSLTLKWQWSQLLLFFRAQVQVEVTWGRIPTARPLPDESQTQLTCHNKQTRQIALPA